MPLVWFFYLSIWGYLLLTLNTIVQAAVATYTVFSEHPDDGGTPCYLKFAWLLYTVSTELSLEVTILYLSCGCNGKISLPSALVHVATSVYVLIDMAITATPIRLLHFIYPVGLKCLYIMASAMFLAAEGTNERDEKFAYSPFDWVYDRGCLKLALAWTLGGSPVLHFLVWTLSLFRKWVHDRISNLGTVNASVERSIKSKNVHG
ncbi:hypothetical protein C0Q70_14696 [Pomacea canaliculata]|uniref:Uncharacterized protein n=2 Tax=Pomacea canaliculata TaxID=400727 RepID=A0A2T7NSU7_POMCA|nr:protein rolling stone-like isoform X2 [Pomacea canaliculata]PVD24226.1 hypothetical protein C0Q70_14696 [Pomacea canaliculata]